MIPSTSNKKPIFQGHNLPQVAHYHLHVQGQYQGRQGKPNSNSNSPEQNSLAIEQYQTIFFESLMPEQNRNKPK